MKTRALAVMFHKPFAKNFPVLNLICRIFLAWTGGRKMFTWNIQNDFRFRSNATQPVHLFSLKKNNFVMVGGHSPHSSWRANTTMAFCSVLARELR